MKLESPAFGHDQPIPAEFTADGRNVSPPVRWDRLPPGTQELALVCEDPDAPRAQPFVHWVAYKIPPAVSELPAGIKRSPKPPAPAPLLQGKNDMGHVGYDGPAPPPGHGTHHYHFRLYALDKPLELEPNLDLKSVIASMSGHIIETAELVGTYARERR